MPPTNNAYEIYLIGSFSTRNWNMFKVQGLSYCEIRSLAIWPVQIRMFCSCVKVC